ncbi:DnaD domain-containing protein [Solibacillus sp. FSL H8-0538]|uniref:DnaD domain-containing protein n=1 Tax=Solibacillus sp. FSL H8-0538 TaxID=2921400 RepID=UPI0030F6A5F3
MNLLINEPPLQVLPSLAVKIGLNNALLLQQVHYWLRISTNHRDGYKWTYKTLEEWHVEFPFWSKRTLDRVIKNLEDEQLLVVGNFNRMKMDRTKWYRIDYENLDKRCNEAFRQNDEMHMDKMTSSISSNCRDANSQNDVNDFANLTTPITREYTENTTETTTDIKNDDEDGKKASPVAQQIPKIETAYSFYQENGFGVLSSHVNQKIGFWMDDLSDELVIHAMKLAVENNALRWNYVETILKDWYNKQLKTLADVEADRLRYEAQKNQKPKQQGYKKTGRQENIPDWFEGRNNKPDVPATTQIADVDFEAERQKILDKLRREE